MTSERKQIANHKTNLTQILNHSSGIEDYKNNFSILYWQPNYFIIVLKDNFKLNGEFFSLISTDYNIELVHHLGNKTQITLTALDKDVETLN